MQSPERPSKQEAFLAYLRAGWASLHLDARRPGVVVPVHLRNEAHLVLQYGHDLPIPIPDLEISEDGVRATLSFSKSPHKTVVPWSAVYLIACDDGRAIPYQDDVPEDVTIVLARPPADLVAAAGAQGEPAGDPALAAPGTNGPSGRISERLLRSVPDDAVYEGSEQEGDVEAGRQAGARRRKRPQLRLVK